MDMTKAFDLVKHSLLFNKLLQAGLPLIFLRLLMYIYMKQYANVKWNNMFSNMFMLTNGVRQGGVISAILYCFYGNQLFSELRLSGYVAVLLHASTSCAFLDYLTFNVDVCSHC